MAPRDEVLQAIRNADATGDSASVRKLGAYLQTLSVQAAEPAQSSGAVVDSANAVGTGYFRGMTRLAGLPVDTVANVVDLGKAAIGMPYIAVTGKAPPSWLEPTDRSRVLGSGENLLRGVRAVGAKGMVDPSNPEYEGGYLQAVGGATGGMLRAGSVEAAAKQVAMLGGSTVASKAVGDATGSQALAITAGMLPFGAQQYGPAAAKAAVRGGEAGRQEMARRVADLKAAGVDNPTLGLASGNKLIGGMENILQSTPGAVGIMQRNRDTAVSGLQAQTGIAADLASTSRGAIESGRSIQKGAADFKTDFKAAF